MNKKFLYKLYFLIIYNIVFFSSYINCNIIINDSLINEIKNDIKSENNINTKNYLSEKEFYINKIFNEYTVNGYYNDSYVYKNIKNEIIKLWVIINKYLNTLDIISPKDEYTIDQYDVTSTERDYNITGSELLEDIFLGSNNATNKHKFITKSKKNITRKKYNISEILNENTIGYILPNDEKDIFVLAIKIAIKKIYNLIEQTEYKLKIFINKNYRAGTIPFFKYHFKYNLEHTLFFYILPTFVIGSTISMFMLENINKKATYYY
jgi:hypothetical protein